MTQPDPFEHFDGAYVLGALDDADRDAFEGHLRGCDACQARVAEVRPTVGLLAAARAHHSAEVEPMPDTLLPRLLREASRERSRRHWLTGGVAALAAACLVTLVVVFWPTSDAARPAPRALAPVRSSPVTATAVLVDHPWGTQIDLRCKYETVTVPRVPYRLVVVDTANRRHDAGSWKLVPGRTTKFTGGTEVRRDRVAKVQVTLPDGTAILQLTL